LKLRAARRAFLIAVLMTTPAFARAPLVDHHQHLMNVSMAESAEKSIDAKKLIAMLDDAGIKRAVVLSNAFMYGNPRANPLPDEYAQVLAENNWTLEQAAQFPNRLVVFCSFNPLKDYALTELARCEGDRRFGRGIKLQFAASDVNLDSEADVEKIRPVFGVANANHLAIVVHMRTRRARPYGAAQAEIFIDRLLSMAPDVPVQIAHFTGGGNPNDTAADEALGVFIAAIKRGDPRVKNLYFDLALVAPPDTPPERKQWVVDRIREIGLARIVYGSDGGDPTDPPPKVQVQAFHTWPLTPAEFKKIERNVAPYLR
jgi:predicted TIM-barrel fold metal-dependent hydrolase